jgi:hypothetical protein
VAGAAGRPRMVRATEGPAPTAAPMSGAGEPWKLRRKTERPAADVRDDPVAAPACRPARVGADTGHEREERRPFRVVAVRKLGPGRGHNRPRQKALG